MRGLRRRESIHGQSGGHFENPRGNNYTVPCFGVARTGAFTAGPLCLQRKQCPCPGSRSEVSPETCSNWLAKRSFRATARAAAAAHRPSRGGALSFGDAPPAAKVAAHAPRCTTNASPSCCYSDIICVRFVSGPQPCCTLIAATRGAAPPNFRQLAPPPTFAASCARPHGESELNRIATTRAGRRLAAPRASSFQDSLPYCNVVVTVRARGRPLALQAYRRPALMWRLAMRAGLAAPALHSLADGTKPLA